MSGTTTATPAIIFDIPQRVTWYRSWENDGYANLLTTVLNINKNTLRAPLYTIHQYYRPDYTYTLGLTALQLAIPFHQTDWPNPPEFRQYRSWEFSEYTGRIPSPQPLNNSFDFPNPRDPREYRSWIFTTTSIPSQIPPPIKGFNQYDWPNPRDPREYRSWVQIVQTSSTEPFIQTDWPNPRDSRDYRTWIWTPVPGNIPPPLQPHNQYDWPNPVPFFRLDETWINQGILSAVLIPFSQVDWPNPREFRELRSWYYSPVPGTIPPPLQPFNQFDWPNPGIPYRIDQTWIFPLTLINPPTPIPPGSQYDWPNPREFRQYREWVFSEYTGIIPPPTQPFNQYYWPNPIDPRDYRSWISSPDLPLIAFPFNQYYWPLPGSYPRPDGTWITIPQLQVPVQLPFNQYDWPLPRIPQPIDQTYVYFNPNTLTILIPPPTNHDWPIPKGFIPIDATWIYSEPPAVIPPPLPPPIIVLSSGKWRDAVLEWKKDTDKAISEAARHMAKLRAGSLSAGQRSAIASKAAITRWKK